MGGGGMKSGQGDYPLCVPRPAAGGIVGGSHERGSGPPLFFLFYSSLFRLHPLCPPGGGKGPRITPPYLALRLCVRCPPVPTKASLSEQAGAHIHPRMGGGMKLRQGYYPLCVPRPAVGGIAGGCMSEEVALRYFFVLFQFVPTLSLVPSGRGKGACYGGVAPRRGPVAPPE